jgi:hypothetical protein
MNNYLSLIKIYYRIGFECGFSVTLVKSNNCMHYQILGEQVTIRSMNKVKGNIFAISGTGFSKLGLPNDFYFQIPGKFSDGKIESIDPFGNLINVLPETLDRQILSIFLHKNIRNGICR